MKSPAFYRQIAFGTGSALVAEMTIRLQCDPVTGKKDIIVSLRSDASVLAHEHEQLHRALVEKLVGTGLLQPDEVGRVLVEREADKTPAALPPQSTSDKRASIAEGN
jgi:hypothetical protein